MKASIKRDGPGEWWWTVGDEEGPIVGGIAPDWPRALDDAQRELQVLGQVDDVLPLIVRPREGIVLAAKRDDLLSAMYRDPAHPLRRAVDAERATLSFRGNVAEDRRPAWRKWLGL